MILFLDDEIFAKPYINKLKDSGLIVDLVTNVYQALDKIESDPTQYKILVLDCMLPVNKKDHKILKDYDIKDGMRTGSAFIQYLIDNQIGEGIVIIILTNILDTTFHSKYNKHKRVYRCLKKRETKPSYLVELIKNLIKGG